MQMLKDYGKPIDRGKKVMEGPLTQYCLLFKGSHSKLSHALVIRSVIHHNNTPVLGYFLQDVDLRSTRVGTGLLYKGLRNKIQISNG